MPTQPPRSHWIDDLRERHTCYRYEEGEARTVPFEYQGREVLLLVPDHLPHVDIRDASATGELLFLIGQQVDTREEDRVVSVGGGHVVMVARKAGGREDAYWVFFWHQLHPQAALYLGS